MAQLVEAFVVSLVISCVLTPLVGKFARVVGAMDNPVERSIHKAPVPYLGGIAIYVAFAAGLMTQRGGWTTETTGILAGGLFIVAFGVLDDRLRFPARLKLLGQAVAAAVLVGCGVRIEWVTNPFGGMFYLGWLGVPLTMFWAVCVMNVINLVDGLDGLAAGISSIATFTLLYVAVTQGNVGAVALTAALSGSTLGFLPYNFNPARIFMGDAGSMFLGFVLAAISVEGALKTTTAAAIVVAALALGLPLVDTTFAVVRRFANGKPIQEADKDHIHHRLLELGLSQRQAVLLMYCVSALLGISAIILISYRNLVSFALLVVVFFLLFLGARWFKILEVQHRGKNVRS